MPAHSVRYAYRRGVDDHDGLTAYVLSEHLRSLDVEFDVYQTAMDMTSTGYRFFLAVDRACVEVLGIHSNSNLDRLMADSVAGWDMSELGLCDRSRMLEYLDSLEGTDKQRLVAFGNRSWGEGGLPNIDTEEKAVAFRKPLLDGLVAIAKERVKVTVVSNGRVIAMAQATGGPGAPLEVRRYKGGTDVNGVTLGECKLHKSGLMIIKKASGAIPATEKVTEVKNELTGHVVKLTATQDTTPKGEEREVKTVGKDETLALTGKDHRKSWVVSVEDEPEETTDTDTEADDS